MRKVLTARVWILIFFLFFSVLAINPSPWASGITIKSVQPGSPLAEAGLKPGESIVSINRQPITTLTNYAEVINDLNFPDSEITIETDKGSFTYSTKGQLGFVQSNLTIVEIISKESGLEKGMKLIAINGHAVTSDKAFEDITKTLFEEKTFILQTDKDEYAILLTHPPEIRVAEAEKSNIRKGLELQGGTRVLLKPASETEVTDNQVQDLIDVLSNRLDVYGIADLKIRPARDLAGNKFVLIEIAGVSREEVREIIAQQGKFEARIGDEVVFRGGKGDIPFVCRNDGSCAGIQPPCNRLAGSQYSCTFQFAITLSEEAAQRHAEVTKELAVNISASGSYLSKQLDLFLDDNLVDSLNIGADLKGKSLTNIAISGPGFGTTEEAAYESAVGSMNKLQTILITGSLPFKLEIAKLDTISPVLGLEFLKNSVTVGLVAILGVSLVIFLRYRKLKIVLPVIFISLSEVVIILGVAALIRWNIDLAAIAGIIAAVGTGVDDQIVIIDEVLKGGERYSSWKEKIRSAFFIILAAYAATVAAMIPLWNAGAGLVRGFAFTTIIGITIGVFITRPAFGSLIQSLMEK